jgi:hypothetical protein
MMLERGVTILWYMLVLINFVLTSLPLLLLCFLQLLVGAKLLWHTVNFTYDLPPPAKINNMFGNCVKWIW